MSEAGRTHSDSSSPGGIRTRRGAATGPCLRWYSEEASSEHHDTHYGMNQWLSRVQTQFRRGQKVWLDNKYAMLVEKTQMLLTGDMEYQLTYDGVSYNSGEWVESSRVKQR